MHFGGTFVVLKAIIIASNFKSGSLAALGRFTYDYGSLPTTTVAYLGTGSSLGA